MPGLTAQDLALLEAETDAYRIEQARAALAHALFQAAGAVVATMEQDGATVLVAIHEAAQAAKRAFEPDSPVAAGFDLLLSWISEGAAP